MFELRLRLGWDQFRMAEHLGIDRATVSRLERGLNPISGPVSKLLDQLEQIAPRAKAS
jgi:transcriptional regulator with XRE-family HTH domain